MKFNIVLSFVILGLTVPDLAESLAICSNMCFDNKLVCAVNTRGIMMEFKSPCYMMRHNICYGTDYETIKIGECPRAKPVQETPLTYHVVGKKETKETNHHH